MATHKVPQDIEADDKFLGPLSFKQFIFAGIALIAGYLTFLTLTSGLWFISIFTIIPFILASFLAFPWSKEQPTELWLASRIRFLIKPRRRIWDQTGMKELVNITVPQREAHVYSDGLSQNEVRNRFGALATMVDTRGWAAKNASDATVASSDRLADGTATAPKVVKEDEDDIMDEQSGTIAKQFDNMIDQSEKKQRSEALALVEQARAQSSPQKSSQATTPPTPKKANTQPIKDATNEKETNKAKDQDFWFMHTPETPADPNLATFQTSNTVQPGTQQPTAQDSSQNDNTQLNEQDLLQKAHEKHRQDELQTATRHEKVINPGGEEKPKPEPQKQAQAQAQKTEVTHAVDPGILELSQSNDLNVETLARQAKKKDDDNEVVVSLH